MGKEKKIRERSSKSFARRIVKVWIGGVLIPLLVVEALLLFQSYRINHESVEQEIESNLNKLSSDMKELMGAMNSVSWLLQVDDTLEKDFHLYFEETDVVKKSNLLTYLRGQIAHYEIANPSIGNITYLYLPKGEEIPLKINKTSLASGELPDQQDFLCDWQNISFYGPHNTKSEVADYPCISLLKEYEGGRQYGAIYIYLESGYKYLQKLIPDRILGMDTIFVIESQDGSLLYSTDEKTVPLNTDLDKLGGRFSRYKAYDRTEEGDWKIYLLVPRKEYYRQIYGMALNLSVITVVVMLTCILVSVIQWRSIYHPFKKFEERLHMIAASPDVENKVEEMNIQEFDDNFALLDKMKSNILLLLNQVQTEEKKRAELEIKSMLGKINPHFLYNTLDTLKWYAAGKKDREMVHFITALNKLLLYNMSKNRETTLKSELDAVSAYIVLQQLKYDLEFSIDTGRHPEILQADMPRFILQPIVENAILHSGANQGKIWIEVELLTNGRIAILVKNNGNPIDPDKIREVLVQKTDISSNGIGLQYVARMLENHFGENFVLKAERLEDEINVMEIQIPFNPDKITKEENAEVGGHKNDKGFRGGR